MSPQVDAILQQIERLDEADRIILEQKLQELIETQWRREAENARTAAQQLGIDQQTIDDAVEEIRYGS
jgi:pimeloyl-CoA synthetase